jgi:hypothetical protein
VEGLTEEGDEVPTPKPIAAHQASEEFSDGIWAIENPHGALFEAL